MFRIYTFLVAFLFSFPISAGLFDAKPSFLPAEQAFVFSHRIENNTLALHWQIADGYYLYQKEIQLQSENATFGTFSFPPAERYQDDFFGEVGIFRHDLALNVPFQAPANATLTVRYQGCTQGFCYPPETRTVTLTQTAPTQAGANLQNLTHTAPLASPLFGGRFALAGFFILGLGLAFTPCVLPMLPLLSAMVIGRQQRPNNGRALCLSLAYVQGMALTYTLLGLIVAAVGLPFQMALQSPAVLLVFAAVFALLALSMFGLFELKLPNALQQKLHQASQKQQGGALGGVFVMGMIAGLIASPCTSAPLSGALLYVAQSGDLLTGALALYLLALGMGVPLVLMTVFGNRILPKSGAWLMAVKTAFGFVMLALPVFLISRVFSTAEPYLWSALGVAFFAWLAVQIPSQTRGKKALKLTALVALALCAKPFADLVWQPSPRLSAPVVAFEPVASLAELEQKLTASRGKKVIVDLYADWCVACKAFEHKTFADPRVAVKLGAMARLRADFSENSPEKEALLKNFNVLGLPTLLFFDEQGVLHSERITGFLNADEFLAWLERM